MGDSTLEKLNLYHFGTLRWQPSPRTVYQTAVDNLAAFRARGQVKHLRSLAKSHGADPRHQGKSKGIAFLVSHIQSATQPSDVLQAAIKGISDGRKSKNVETLYMYQDLKTLEHALDIAQAIERHDCGAVAAK